MKWILILVLVFVIMLIAKGLSQQYKDKFEFYSNLQAFFKQFKLNLSFKQEKIETFLCNFNADKQFGVFLKNYKEYLRGKELDLNIKFLDEKEVAEISDMLKAIGNHDAKSEMEQLDSFIEITNSKLEKSKQDKARLCPMIIKLSLLFAMALAILLL